MIQGEVLNAVNKAMTTFDLYLVWHAGGDGPAAALAAIHIGAEVVGGHPEAAPGQPPHPGNPLEEIIRGVRTVYIRYC
jgi:hypothetical protein